MNRPSDEDQKEALRKKTLYAHSDMLERIADGVKAFFENDFGKSEN